MLERGVAFIIGAHDREIIAWHAVVGSDISGGMVRDMMLEAVENRFGALQVPAPLEWLTDNGSAYTAKETRLHRRAKSHRLLHARPEPRGRMGNRIASSKPSNDYVRINTLPDAITALGKLAGFEDYNENHLHSGLKMRSRGSSYGHNSIADCPGK